MSEIFQSGLAEALPALQAMKNQKKKVSASRETLKALRAAKPVSASVQEAPAARKSDRRIVGEDSTLPDLSRFENLESLRKAALACLQCPHLVASRTGVVFGVGNPKAELMFVGEAPGADEDEQGEPFVGRAGQLLTKIISAMGYSREEIYIANVLKCRPDMPAGESGNRKPKTSEMETCLPWLRRQIDLIRPRAMVALGSTAVEGLLGQTEPIGKLRGRWLEFQNIPVMATYHPAYLLRNQSISEKRKVWEDMLLVLEKLQRPISEKQRRFFTAASE
jgi:DNA polymerase